MRHMRCAPSLESATMHRLGVDPLDHLLSHGLRCAIDLAGRLPTLVFSAYPAGPQPLVDDLHVDLFHREIGRWGYAGETRSWLGHADPLSRALSRDGCEQNMKVIGRKLLRIHIMSDFLLGSKLSEARQ
jgi:hypothetical protein